MADITGMDEFLSKVASINAEMATALPGIAAAAADILYEEISRRIPRLSGDLAQHLETETTHTARQASATVQIAESAPQGVEHKAVFLEYGTSKMQAEPFFRPGFEAGKERAIAAATEVVRSIVEK